MKPERGNGGVTRGMMGKNLVAQGTQFDSERCIQSSQQVRIGDASSWLRLRARLWRVELCEQRGIADVLTLRRF